MINFLNFTPQFDQFDFQIISLKFLSISTQLSSDAVSLNLKVFFVEILLNLKFLKFHLLLLHLQIFVNPTLNILI